MATNCDAALGHLLCVLCQDRSVNSPVAVFTRDLLSAKRPMQSLEETITHFDAELADEQEEVALQVDQCNIAKEKLVAELQRVEHQLKELSERSHVIATSRNFCKLARSVDFSGSGSVPEPDFPAAAMAKPSFSVQQSRTSQPRAIESEELGGADASSPNGHGDIGHLVSLLRNPETKESVLATTLTKFEMSIVPLVETRYDDSQLKEAMLIAQELVAHLHVPRPPLQVTELRILTILLKRSIIDQLGAVQEVALRAGAAAQLAKLIASVNDDVKCEAFECLSALLTSESDSESFVQCGGITPLVSVVASSTNELVLERALIIMWTLSSVSDTLRSTIRGEGGLHAALDLLYTDSLVILENVTSAIGFLTREEATKDAIRDNGGLEKLVATLFHPSSTIQGKVCGAIWNCASNQTNRGYLRQIGCIPALLELLATSSNEAVLENAAGALWNLAADQDNKAQMVDFEGIPILIGHLSTQLCGMLASVAGTLWNLSACAENRPVIRKSGGIPVIVKLLDHPDEQVQENVSGLLRNLAINDQIKSAIRECGGIEKLLAVIASAPSVVVMEKVVSTLWIIIVVNESKHQLRMGDGIPILLNLFKTAKTETIREKALGILRRACMVPENRPVMLEAGTLQVVGGYALSIEFSRATIMVKEAFAALVWNLSRDDKEVAARLGLIKPVCQLLSDREVSVVEQAAGALASITVTSPENRITVREAGGLETALRLITTLHPEQQSLTLLNVILLVRNCTSANPANQQLLVQMRVVQPLLNIMRVGKDDLKREVALCLKNAAATTQGASEIIRCGGRELLGDLADRSQNENVRKAALIAIQAVQKSTSSLHSHAPH